MKTQLKKATFLDRARLGFMGSALLVMLVTISPIHAGWLVEEQKLTALDALEGDRFGSSIAVDGDTAVVGVPGDDGEGASSGSAYIFIRSGATWSEHAKLTASDAAAGAGFGFSVAITGDIVVVGANGHLDPGSAYVFIRSGHAWSEQAKLLPSSEEIGGGVHFGISVAISGSTVVVGASGFQLFGGGDPGKVFVFIRNGGSWSEQAKLVAPDTRPGASFGEAVAISGNTVVVGATNDHNGGDDSGAAYIFVRNENSWSQQSKLVGSDTERWDHFGSFVAISGNRVVVGSPGTDDGGNSSGSAYVFAHTGDAWSEQAKLVALDAAAEDQFGYSVAISGDVAVVGAPHRWGNAFGSAYIFKGVDG